MELLLKDDDGIKKAIEALAAIKETKSDILKMISDELILDQHHITHQVTLADNEYIILFKGRGYGYMDLSTFHTVHEDVEVQAFLDGADNWVSGMQLVPLLAGTGAGHPSPSKLNDVGGFTAQWTLLRYDTTAANPCYIIQNAQRMFFSKQMEISMVNGTGATRLCTVDLTIFGRFEEIIDQLTRGSF